jgi:carbonic anhydrase
MRLFEAIIEANHRAVAGDTSAGLRPADFETNLPVIALTCVDPRLNAIFPNVLGLPGDQFIWLRNAGNIVTGPMSSTMRSLALACAVKGGQEIAVIGHSDCQVCKITTMQLLERFRGFGVERHLLPENLNEFFGMAGSERQNVLKACEFIHRSPLIGPTIPVHGFLVDIETGKLEWLVNGYQTFAPVSEKWNEVVKSAGETVDALKALTDFNIGEMKFPETKIGETVSKAEDWLVKKIEQFEVNPTASDDPATPQRAANVAKKIVEIAGKHWPRADETPERPPKIPLPPPIRPRMTIRKSNPGVL